jgi:hypothetical protein
MNDVALLGIRVESSQAQKASDELDELAIAAARAEKSTDRLANVATAKVAPGMSKAAYQSRMVALQLSQVSQQGMASGNFLQALAIQLPDMAVGFGTVGIAAGVLASVALPLLASAFGTTGDEALEAKEAMELLQAATDNLRAAQDLLGLSLPELYEQYGNYALQVREAAKALLELEIAEARSALATTIYESADALNQFIGAAEMTRTSGAQTATAVAALRDQLGLTGQTAIEVSKAFEAVQNAVTFEDRVAALRNLDATLKAAGVSAERLPAPVRQMLIEANNATLVMAELQKETQDAADAAAVLAGAGPQAGWLAGAIGDASTLADRLWDAAAAAAAAREGQLSEQYAAMGDDERGGQRLQDRSAGEWRRNEAIRTRNSAGGGGGGGGGADQFATDLDALIENLRSKREIEDEWYEENLVLLQDRRAEELLGVEGHKQALIDLELEYQNRIAEIEAEAHQKKLSDTANMFGALAGIAAAGGKKTAKAVATFQAIEGTINAYGAAIKALNTPGISLAGRFAAYASVLAAGLKGVAAIKSAGGGSGGGGGGRGQVPSQGIEDNGNTVEYRVYGLERDAVYSGAFLEKMWEGLFEEGKRRGADRSKVVFV